MDIRYTAEHEWVAVDGNRATVGITDFAQRALGDLVFVQLPAIGSAAARGAPAAVVESSRPHRISTRPCRARSSR